MTVDTTKYRKIINARRKALGDTLEYSDANRDNAFRVTKLKVSAPDLEELLDAYDRLKDLCR
jgi:hypothetical protein